MTAGFGSRWSRHRLPPRLCTSVLKQVGLDVFVVALSTKRLKLCRNNDLQSKAKKRSLYLTALLWAMISTSSDQHRHKRGCGAEAGWGLASPRAGWLVGMLGAL